jgi:hypothetical protein
MNKKPLLPPVGARVLKYELRFNVSEKGLQENRVVVVDVNDTGDERTNKADAIVTATLKLDREGIKHWVFKGCANVTS